MDVKERMLVMMLRRSRWRRGLLQTAQADSLYGRLLLRQNGKFQPRQCSAFFLVLSLWLQARGSGAFSKGRSAIG